MNKTDFRRSGLISAMLVALTCAVFVPAVSADQAQSQNPYSLFGEGVGAGVSAGNFGSYYYCYWHVGRWLGTCDWYHDSLYFSLYADGDEMPGSTDEPTYDDYYYGPLSSLGASAYTGFYKVGFGSFYQSSGYAGLP